MILTQNIGPRPGQIWQTTTPGLDVLIVKTFDGYSTVWPVTRGTHRADESARIIDAGPGKEPVTVWPCVETGLDHAALKLAVPVDLLTEAQVKEMRAAYHAGTGVGLWQPGTGEPGLFRERIIMTVTLLAEMTPADSEKPSGPSTESPRFHVGSSCLLTREAGAEGGMEVLIVKGAGDDTWRMPGGPIKGEETPWSCAERVLSEQTGLELGSVGLRIIAGIRQGPEDDGPGMDFVYDFGTCPEDMTVNTWPLEGMWADEAEAIDRCGLADGVSLERALRSRADQWPTMIQVSMPPRL